jgi:hypothetical protein
MTLHSNQLMRGSIHRLLRVVLLFVYPTAPRYPLRSSVWNSFPTLEARIAPIALVALAPDGSTPWQPPPQNRIQNP